MSFLDKIDRFCKERHMSTTRFEREAGLSKGLVLKWRSKGFYPSHRSQKKVAGYIGISVQDLMSEDLSDFSQGPVPDNWSHAPDVVREASVRFIPVFRYSGLAALDKDDIFMHLPVLPSDIESPEECFGTVIEDSSMSPDFDPDDIVIVRKDTEPISGDIVIVLVPGDQVLCRRLILDGSNIILQPFSRHYAPSVYREEERDLLPVLFLGKLIARYGKVNSSSCSIPED